MVPVTVRLRPSDTTITLPVQATRAFEEIERGYSRVTRSVRGSIEVEIVSPPELPQPETAVAVPDKVGYAQLRPVIEQRCAMCHGEQVQMKNVRLDSPEAMRQHAQSIYQQVVVTRLMPMNNATGITEAERALIAQWFQAGAPAR